MFGTPLVSMNRAKMFVRTFVVLVTWKSTFVRMFALE